MFHFGAIILSGELILVWGRSTEQRRATISSMALKAELTVWMGNTTEIPLRGGPGVSLLSLITLKKPGGEEMKAQRHHFYSKEERQTSRA